MNNRRDFMKTSLVASAAVMAAVAPSMASSTPRNIYAYSTADQGRWQGKAGSHAPVVTAKDGKVTVETRHGMAPKHYIVKHTIVTENGDVLGEHVFDSSDKKAISSYEIAAKGAKLYALSFCNLHDLWVSEFNV